MNTWRRYILTVPEEQEEALAVRLLDLGFPGMELHRKDPGEVDLTVYAPENSAACVDPATLDALLAGVARYFPGTARGRWASDSIRNEDWAETWKEYFAPFRVGPHLVIRPSWTSYHTGADERVLVLDPGRAFGTGQHATTALCLKALQRLLAPDTGTGFVPRTLLDVGTGAGILAMAGALLGIPRVLGVDVDPEAVSAATENVRGNRLTEQVAIRLGGPETIQESFDLVVANLDVPTLTEIASDLKRLLGRGARLLLSGIPTERAAQLEGRFAPLPVTGKDIEGEWVLLEFLNT